MAAPHSLAMELRVESAEGSTLPPGCFVGVRVGDVLKQGRYEPQRCYHFPQVDRRRNAKIDVYQHVGSCVVAVDPEAKSTHEVSVTSTDPSCPSMRLKVNVQTKGDEVGKQQRETRTKALKNQAKDYLSKHSIEERLSEAVKALLKEQPADPTEFLCRQLRGESNVTASSKPEALGAAAAAKPSAAVSRELPQASAPPPAAATQDGKPQKDLGALRQQACDVLMKASLDGELTTVLQEVKAELGQTPKANSQSAAPQSAAQKPAKDLGALRTQACDVLMKASVDGSLTNVLQEVKADTAKNKAPNSFAAPGGTPVLPSVTCLSPSAATPMMMPMMSVMGSSFATSGMAPGLLFF